MNEYSISHLKSGLTLKNIVLLHKIRLNTVPIKMKEGDIIKKSQNNSIEYESIP